MLGMSIRERASLLLLGILLAGAWILAVAPEQERGRRTARELEQLEKQAQSAESTMGTLLSTEREIREGMERLQRLQERILPTRDLGRILTLLSHDTRALGIKIVSMQPLEEQAASEGNPTRRLPVEMELQGRLLDLGRYLEALQSAPVLFTIEGVQLIRADRGSRLAMRLVAVAHIGAQGQ